MASPARGQVARSAARERADVVLDAYDRYHTDLLGYLARFCGSRDAAEDLLQETFLLLVRELRAGREPRDMRPWLYRVATNRARSRGRRLAVVQRFLSRLYRPDVAPAPDESLLRSEARGELQRAVLSLPPDARSAVLLAADGFSGLEIGELLGRSPLATRSLLFRARRTLRARLQGTEASA